MTAHPRSAERPSPTAPFDATIVHSEQRVAIEEAERIVFEVYGLRASIETLTGEADENFRVSAAHGEFILKIASPVEDPAVIDLSISALCHIERADPSFPSPRVQAGLDGRRIARVRDGAGRDRQVRLLTWLPGQMLEDAPRSSKQRAACGATAARLALALRDFRHPAAARPMLWDLCQLVRLRPMLDDLPGYSAAPYIAEFLDAYQTFTEPAFTRSRRQVLHNDMNLRNVLVDPHNPARIVGLIDFGDIVETALVADLAVVASAQLLRGSTSVQADIMDTVNAYQTLVPLLDDELAVLNWLIAGRLVCGLLIPEWHRVKNPASRHFPAKDEAANARRIELVETVKRLRLG